MGSREYTPVYDPRIEYVNRAYGPLTWFQDGSVGEKPAKRVYFTIVEYVSLMDCLDEQGMIILYTSYIVCVRRRATLVCDR